MDGLLSRSMISKEMLKLYGNRVHDLGKCAVLVLHRAAEELNGNIVAVLLDSLQASEHTDSLVQLLLAQDNDGKSAYFMAIERGNVQVLEKLWDCAKTKLKKEKINTLLLATNTLGMTALQLATYWGKLEILQKMWEWAKT